MCFLVALVKAMCATMRCTSSGCMGPGDKISLFLQDWELAKVALCPHGPGHAVPGKCVRPGRLGDATERPAVTA